MKEFRIRGPMTLWVFVALLAVAGAWLNPAASRAQSETESTPGASLEPAYIYIRSLGFEPALLNVEFGQRVIWQNNDEVAHSVVDETGHFNSGLILPGSTFEFVYPFVGEFTYHCDVHQQMTGMVIVGTPEDPGSELIPPTSTPAGGITRPNNPPPTPTPPAPPPSGDTGDENPNQVASPTATAVAPALGAATATPVRSLTPLAPSTGRQVPTASVSASPSRSPEAPTSVATTAPVLADEDDGGHQGLWIGLGVGGGIFTLAMLTGIVLAWRRERREGDVIEVVPAKGLPVRTEPVVPVAAQEPVAVVEEPETSTDEPAEGAGEAKDEGQDSADTVASVAGEAAPFDSEGLQESSSGDAEGNPEASSASLGMTALPSPEDTSETAVATDVPVDSATSDSAQAVTPTGAPGEVVEPAATDQLSPTEVAAEAEKPAESGAVSDVTSSEEVHEAKADAAEPPTSKEPEEPSPHPYS